MMQLLSDHIKFWFVYLVWLLFHALALLLSYAEVGIFNFGSSPSDTELFWPFVSFGFGDTFYGMFNRYDWTEFIVYAFLPLAVFFLKLLYEKAFPKEAE